MNITELRKASNQALATESTNRANSATAYPEAMVKWGKANSKDLKGLDDKAISAEAAKVYPSTVTPAPMDIKMKRTKLALWINPTVVSNFETIKKGATKLAKKRDTFNADKKHINKHGKASTNLANDLQKCASLIKKGESLTDKLLHNVAHNGLKDDGTSKPAKAKKAAVKVEGGEALLAALKTLAAHDDITSITGHEAIVASIEAATCAEPVKDEVDIHKLLGACTGKPAAEAKSIMALVTKVQLGSKLTAADKKRIKSLTK